MPQKIVMNIRAIFEDNAAPEMYQDRIERGDLGVVDVLAGCDEDDIEVTFEAL